MLLFCAAFARICSICSKTVHVLLSWLEHVYRGTSAGL